MSDRAKRLRELDDMHGKVSLATRTWAVSEIERLSARLIELERRSKHDLVENIQQAKRIEHLENMLREMIEMTPQKYAYRKNSADRAQVMLDWTGEDNSNN